MFALRHNGEQNGAFFKSVASLKIIQSTCSAAYKAKEEKNEPLGTADRQTRENGRLQRQSERGRERNECEGMTAPGVKEGSGEKKN